MKDAITCLSVISEELKDYVLEYFMINNYMTHPENLLYSGLLCPWSTPEVKQKSLDLILKFRAVKRRSRSRKIRKFKGPKNYKIKQGPLKGQMRNEFNFNATTILEMINWDEKTGLAKFKRTPPPLFETLTDEEVKGLLHSKSDKIYVLKCHSQDNERWVQYVTKSVSKVVSHADQRSDLLCSQDSRDKHSSTETKGEFIAKRNLQF